MMILDAFSQQEIGKELTFAIKRLVKNKLIPQKTLIVVQSVNYFSGMRKLQILLFLFHL
jgi:hypothetical protein